MNKNNQDNPLVGGQAVIEGVMMRGSGRIATAVRTPHGSIVSKVQDFVPFTERHKIFNVLIVRGFINLVEMLILGIKSLSFSANVALEDDKNKSDTINNWEFFFSFVIAFLTAICLFIVIPAGVFVVLKNNIHNILLLNFIEGLVRISIFFIFLLCTMFSSDMRRVFQYHGAEHKTVHAYENGDELVYSNIRKCAKEHNRCGTSFIMIVFVISILIFSFLGRTSYLLRVAAKISLMPLIAGISYEIIKFLAKHENVYLLKMFTWPGVLTQKITTKEPDQKQIEIAIAALKKVV